MQSISFFYGFIYKCLGRRNNAIRCCYIFKYFTHYFITGRFEPEKYAATQASSALKSDAPLFKTPQSVSVITREQLDQKQATTLSQAINGVAGVSAGYLGVEDGTILLFVVKIRLIKCISMDFDKASHP